MLKGLFFTDETDVKLTRLGGNNWRAMLTAPKNSILRYRYSRGNDFAGSWDKEESYIYRNGQFRYRELLAQKDLVINETVSKWEDLALSSAGVGIISGTITSSATGLPVMGLRISAGAFQAVSFWDGSYSIPGAPAGKCALTVYSDNGQYQPQVFEVTVPASGVVSQNITVTPALMSVITLTLLAPSDTPTLAVPKISGNTFRLGSFPSDEGSASHVGRTVDMTNVSTNVWTASVDLGVGSAFTYVYTLGDYRLNQERDSSGNDIIRTLNIVSATGTAITDTVAAWKKPTDIALNFTTTAPVSDTVFVTNNAWDGWEPLKMWPVAPGQWSYTLYTAQSQTLQYRYIRNGDPAIGVEKLDPDLSSTYREVVITTANKVISDTIPAWRHQLRQTLPGTVTLNYTGPITDRVSGQAFQRGIELIDYWRPEWQPLVDNTIQRISDTNAGWVQIASVWGILSFDPPIVDMKNNSLTEDELLNFIRTAHNKGLKVTVRAFPYPLTDLLSSSAFDRTNTNAWYDEFYSQVKGCLMYHAKICEQEGVEMLMLPNFSWLDDNNVATATYINGIMTALVADIKTVYSGKLTSDTLSNRTEYDWFGDLDYIGDIWWVALAATTTPVFADYEGRGASEAPG